MIKIEDVNFGYASGKHVFDALNVEWKEPGVYGLLGLNGSGKTTLLKLLSSLIFPNKGTITIDGEDVTKREVSTLSKMYFLADEAEGLKMKFRDFVKNYAPFYDHFNAEVLADCLQQFKVDEEVRIDKMSLGEKKKAFVSFALAVGTEILLLDEPTNGLDILSKKVFRQLLMKYIGDDQTVIIATHLVCDIANLLDHFIILKEDGKAFSQSSVALTKRYAFVKQRDEQGALYAEPCAEGYRVIKANEGEETAIDIELLFNAVIKKAIL